MNSLLQAVRSLGRSRPVAAVPRPERRVQPRVSRRLKVQLAGLALESTNVTASGLQLGCPEHRLATLRSQWDPAATPVAIELPDGVTVSARCSIAYVSPCDDEFLIGLTFLELDDEARDAWHAYLARLPQPGGPGTVNG